MIVKRKDGYHLLSKDGKKHLGGPWKKRAQALAREAQIEWFKKNKNKKS